MNFSELIYDQSTYSCTSIGIERTVDQSMFIFIVETSLDYFIDPAQFNLRCR